GRRRSMASMPRARRRFRWAAAGDHIFAAGETLRRASRWLGIPPLIRSIKMAYDAVRTAKPDLKETHDLIASDKVEGTKVYDPAGEHIGSIERILVEKRSGKVSYAVLSFGG